jgi:cystathionine beta-lyase family protein involved in aluminum resistance
MTGTRQLYEENSRLVAAYRQSLGPVWDEIDENVALNQSKVLDAFISERIGLSHFWGSTGYGYGDTGREALDRVFARAFGGEAGLVRTHWASGTHVLSTALKSLLRTGDSLVSVTGTPYDTLRPVLEHLTRERGVTYRETDALARYQEGALGLSELEKALDTVIDSKTRVAMLQRSRGYSQRQPISISCLRDFMDLMKRKWPHVLTMVDNCYCEFVETSEPPQLGATLTAGSLIKNPGGGLAPTGGYLVGDKAAVERASEELFAPGIGPEVGSNPHGYRDFFQGLFLAPKIVGEALKGACFAAMYFGDMGFPVAPGPFDLRSDIVQAITVGTPKALKTLACAIQAASPVDSFASPEPWDMPGYGRQIIMAAGAFVQGSSIELSCDAPFVPPYTAFLQGGLTKEHVIIACLRAGKALSENRA